MTRTARLKNKKESRSASSWEELKGDVSQSSEQGGNDNTAKHNPKLTKRVEVLKKSPLKVTTHSKLKPSILEKLKKNLRKKTEKKLKQYLSDTLPLLKTINVNDFEGEQQEAEDTYQEAHEKERIVPVRRKRTLKKKISKDRTPLLHSNAESSLSDESRDSWMDSVNLGGGTSTENNDHIQMSRERTNVKPRKVGGKRVSRIVSKTGGGGEVSVARDDSGGGSGGVSTSRRMSDEKRRKRIEHRKLRRQRRKVCFNCRQPGHWVGECSQNMSSTGVCFKCGSAEHSCQQCRVKVPPGEFPFAKCFICGDIGHLSRSCPDNPRGLYPKGGGCKLCGSVEHLKANCPEKQKSSGRDTGSTSHNAIKTTGHGSSADAEVFAEEGKPLIRKTLKRRKEKVVKF